MKFAYVTTLCDKYINGFFITFQSILNSHENFDNDLVIIEWGELSDHNKQKIKTLYRNVYFKQIEKEQYKNHFFDTYVRDWGAYKPSYRFEIFTLNDYEKILYFDSDIIFEVDSRDLLQNKNIKFGACQMLDYSNYYQTISDKIFNAGLMVIDNCFLTEKVKNDLIKMSLSSPPKDTLNDNFKWIGNQPILNNYFINDIFWLDEKYNLMIDRINRNNIKNKNNYHLIGKNKIWFDGDLYKKYDRFVIDIIKSNQNNNEINCFILLKKIIKKYDNLLLDLKNKNIIL